MDIVSFSNTALVIALFLYMIAFFSYTLAVTGQRFKNRDPKQHNLKWRKIATTITIVGLVSHFLFFITRWGYSGHIPVSNMFEFMTFFAMMITSAFLIVYAIYRTAVIGIFALPVSVLILAYASVFPWEAQPLIPALQHWWLMLHVTTAAAGEAFFAVGFAAGLMYLLRTVDFKSTTKKGKWERRGVEISLLTLLITIGFILSVFTFRGLGYEASFEKVEVTNQEEVVEVIEYTLPVIFAPHDAKLVSMTSFLGIDQPLFEAPGWMQGVSAGRKLNTIIWSVISGLLLYGVVRLVLRKPIGEAIQPIMGELDPEDLDEISYRSIAIGFPVFTLGALIFAMIWAKIAWSRFWGWDPKEVWALITWLFYSVYLHLRLSRGYIGAKSSWLAVIGFVIVMFTLIGVNLIIAGLHSYAGV